MGMILWKEKYNIGNEKIDGQHKQLLKIINSLDNTSLLDNSQIEEIIKKLIEYTKFHFAQEEEIMKKIDYPNITEHLDEHSYFVERLDNLRNKLHNDEDIKEDISYFLSDWLISHILNIDKELTLYVENEKVEVLEL